MSVCTACGTEIPEGARYCQNCGSEVAGPGMPDAAVMPAPAGDAVTPFPAPVWQAPPVAPYTYPPPPYSIIPGQTSDPARSGKAVAGMWLGIASIPGIILTWVGVILAVLGLIFSLLALRDIRQWEAMGIGVAPRDDRRKAIAGAICSVVGGVAASTLFVYILTHLEQFGIHLTR